MFGKLSAYLRDSYAELKKVNWPSKKETVRYTLIVIGISLSVALFLGALDLIFSYLLRIVLA